MVDPGLALTELRRHRQRLVDIAKDALYALGVRWMLVMGLCWLAAGAARAQTQPAVGTCLGGSCELGAPVIPQQDIARRRTPPRGSAPGAAWSGAVSGALSLGGSIAIASLNDHESETITRGVWVGFTALSVPIVAIGSYTTRKRARVEGYRGIRTLGWTSYVGALSNGIAQWYLVLIDAKPTPGFTVGVGALGLMAFLPHAFDAYVSGRAARTKGLASMRPTPNGFAVRF